MNAPKTLPDVSGLKLMHQSLARLNEKAELLAAQRIMARTETPETEEQRRADLHAQVRAAMYTTAVKVTATIARDHRFRPRKKRNLIEEVIAEIEHEAPTERQPDAEDNAPATAKRR
jgi:hypothetical protein